MGSPTLGTHCAAGCCEPGPAQPTRGWLLPLAALKQPPRPLARAAAGTAARPPQEAQCPPPVAGWATEDETGLHVEEATRHPPRLVREVAAEECHGKTPSAPGGPPSQAAALAAPAAPAALAAPAPPPPVALAAPAQAAPAASFHWSAPRPGLPAARR